MVVFSKHVSFEERTSCLKSLSLRQWSCPRWHSVFPSLPAACYDVCQHASLGKVPLACVYNVRFTGKSGQPLFQAPSNSSPLSLFDLQNNQVLGIGSGSTIVHAVHRLGRMLPFVSLPPQKVPLSSCPNYLKNMLNRLDADLLLMCRVCSLTAVSSLKLKVKTGCCAPNLWHREP